MEVRISSNGFAVAPMEVNCNFSNGFNSDGPAVAQMELNCNPFDGFSSDDSKVALGKTNVVNSQLLKGIFLAGILQTIGYGVYGFWCQ